MKKKTVLFSFLPLALIAFLFASCVNPYNSIEMAPPAGTGDGPAVFGPQALPGGAQLDGLPAFPRNDIAPTGPDAMDATVEMLGEKEIAIRAYAAQVGPGVATQVSSSGDPATAGDTILVTVSDVGLGIDYDESFTVLMDGTHGIILIETAAYANYDETTDEYVFPNPYNVWRL